MPLQITCSACSVKLKVKDELIGKAVKCPKCGETVTIPVNEGLAAAGSDEPRHAASHETTNAKPSSDGTRDLPAGGATASYQPGNETKPTGTAQASDLPMVPGYRVLREIARGGMGRVLAAHDINLDRAVALKILLPGANADRFVRESKITARLPHPGIPPVHALGTLADGSPFLAMKLIAGRTLAVEMKFADRPRLLQAFTRVCQAVGFAHSRGIIHRDLKPANIMVGAFGEVQVMDWGLAKELISQAVGDEPQSSETPTIPTLGSDANRTIDHREPRESADDQTRAGQVMGTPTYMAPEQARGEATDTRADVFALGGILCAILTGQPPFHGRSSREVIQRAQAADLADTMTRLNRCEADTELIDLTKSCLAPNAIDRPKDAQAVADAMAAHLEGVEERLQQARLAEAEAKTRATEARKRRRLALALAATVLLAVTLGGGGWLWVKVEQDVRTAQVTSEINDALKQASELRENAKAATEGGAALALFSRAREQAQRASTLAESDPVDDRLTSQAQSLQAELAAEEAVVEEAVGVYRRAFAINPERVSEREVDEAISLYRRAIALYPNYVNAHAGLGSALRARGQTDDAIECCRRAIALDPMDANAHLGLGAALRAKGQTDEAIESYRQAITLDPKLAMAHTGLGSELHKQGKLDEAIVCHNQAIALNPNLAVAHTNLGLALAGRGHAGGAIACYHRAIELDPKDAIGHASLGLALVGKRNLDDAVASCRQAIGLNPKLALAHAGLGLALAGKQQTDEAIKCYRQAIALDPKLALAHTNLGVALVAKREINKAIASCRQAVALDPKDANAHVGLGWALNANGEADDAITCCRRAVALDVKNDNAHFVLGDALLGNWKTEEAIASYRRAIVLDPKHAPARANLGFSLSAKGETNEAILCLREALAIAPRDLDANYWMGVAVLRKGTDEGRDLNEVIGEVSRYFQIAGAIDKNRVNDLLKKSERITEYYKAKNAEKAPIGLVHEVGKGLELRGQLDKKSPTAVYHVKLAPGKTYVIDMVSPNPQSLDPFLVLSDAAGKKLAEDDDGGGDRNARIVFRAEQAGAFRIEAKSFQNRGTGPFTLTVRESTNPNQPKASLAQARGHAARGDWNAATAEYARAFAEQPLKDGERGFEYAAVLLLKGDQAGYRKFCSELLDRSGQPGIRPYHVARACTLVPASVKEAALAGRMAENELRNAGREFWSLTEQGALAYRAGRYDEAATLLEKSLQADRKPGRAVLNWVWLSLVEHRRGKPAEAQAWLEKANKWLDQHPKDTPVAEDDATGLHLHNWLEAQIVRREAAQLLVPKK